MRRFGANLFATEGRIAIYFPLQSNYKPSFYGGNSTVSPCDRELRMMGISPEQAEAVLHDVKRTFVPDIFIWLLNPGYGGGPGDTILN